jgi:hypothetical protein
MASQKSKDEKREGMSEFEIRQLDDPFAKLPALAERLGVEPAGADERAGVYFVLKDGRRYSLFALASAFLDRMDGAL